MGKCAYLPTYGFDGQELDPARFVNGQKDLFEMVLCEFLALPEGPEKIEAARKIALYMHCMLNSVNFLRLCQGPAEEAAE